MQTDIPFQLSDCDGQLCAATFSHEDNHVSLITSSAASEEVDGCSDSKGRFLSCDYWLQDFVEASLSLSWEEKSAKGGATLTNTAALIDRENTSAAARFNTRNDVFPSIHGTNGGFDNNDFFETMHPTSDEAALTIKASADYSWISTIEQGDQNEGSMPVRMKKKGKGKCKSTNTSVGYCQHPKHLSYRSEAPTHQLSTTAATPRRGRPPKGTKPTDKKQLNVDASSSAQSTDSPHFDLLQCKMTIRPLPKRLEAVVGQKDIRVCLTCLKKSDVDLDYLNHPAYRAPQTHRKMKSQAKQM